MNLFLEKEKLGLMRTIKLKNIGQILEVHAGDKIRKNYCCFQKSAIIQNREKT